MPGAQQLTLLYVDDNPDDLHLMQLAVAQARATFNLQLVNGYYEAVEYLSVQGKFSVSSKNPKPALVLIDYFLGSYTGGDLVAWIREQPALPALPLVIFTQGKELQEMAKCYVAGADYYLVKHATFDGLIKIVRCLDECLRCHPPQLDPLRELAVRAEFVQQALRSELREGVTEHRKLMRDLKANAGQLDGVRAEQKERKKQFPFPKERKKPEGE